MQSLEECVVEYRRTLKQLLFEAGIPSNPAVEDKWILNHISRIIRSNINGASKQPNEDGSQTEPNVGKLREKLAFCAADRPVIAITSDEILLQLLNGRKLKVVEFVPDITDGSGNLSATFKVLVALDE